MLLWPYAIQYYLDTIKQLEQGSPHYVQMRRDLAELSPQKQSDRIR